VRSERLFGIIKELRAELETLDHVIRRIEGIAEGRLRRGRPPKAVASAKRGLAEAIIRKPRDNDA
jgi:hypothetical protein